MGNDFKATSVIICDDIRREASGKEILIGVYAGVILLPALPTLLPTLSTRIEFTTSLSRADDLAVELRDPDGEVVFSVHGHMDMIGTDGIQLISVVCNGVQFTKEGKHTLVFGRKDALEPAHSINVRIAK